MKKILITAIVAISCFPLFAFASGEIASLTYLTGTDGDTGGLAYLSDTAQDCSVYAFDSNGQNGALLQNSSPCPPTQNIPNFNLFDPAGPTGGYAAVIGGNYPMAAYFSDNFSPDTVDCNGTDIDTCDSLMNAAVPDLVEIRGSFTSSGDFMTYTLTSAFPPIEPAVISQDEVLFMFGLVVFFLSVPFWSTVFSASRGHYDL